LHSALLGACTRFPRHMDSTCLFPLWGPRGSRLARKDFVPAFYVPWLAFLFLSFYFFSVPSLSYPFFSFPFLAFLFPVRSFLFPFLPFPVLYVPWLAFRFLSVSFFSFPRLSFLSLPFCSMSFPFLPFLFSSCPFLFFVLFLSFRFPSGFPLPFFYFKLVGNAGIELTSLSLFMHSSNMLCWIVLINSARLYE
jgi:hypothetical protein